MNMAATAALHSISLTLKKVTQYYCEMKFLYARYPRSTVALCVLTLVFFALAWTGTLSYPAIMLDRQIQLISRCVIADSSFVAEDFGFSFLAPSDYCVLPHRLFPRDGSIQVVPRGWYFVVNEYAAGTIATESRASILFDFRTEIRNKAAFLAALEAGGFLDGATVEEHENATGLRMTIVRNARGIEEGRRFNWAFVDHPTKPISVSVLSSFIGDPIVFWAVLDGMRAI